MYIYVLSATHFNKSSIFLHYHHYYYKHTEATFFLIIFDKVAESMDAQIFCFVSFQRTVECSKNQVVNKLIRFPYNPKSEVYIFQRHDGSPPPRVTPLSKKPPEDKYADLPFAACRDLQICTFISGFFLLSLPVNSVGFVDDGIEQESNLENGNFPDTYTMLLIIARICAFLVRFNGSNR